MADNPFSPPDKLQGELTTTCHLLGELGISSSEENAKALDLLRELKEMTQKKDLELQRYYRKYFLKKIVPLCLHLLVGQRWAVGGCPVEGVLCSGGWAALVFAGAEGTRVQRGRERGIGKMPSTQPKVLCSFLSSQNRKGRSLPWGNTAVQGPSDSFFDALCGS